MKSTPIKEVRQKIKKLRKDLIALENATPYQCFRITKLRTVSGLCKDEDDLCHFAFYIANKIADKIFEKEEETVKEFVEKAMPLMSDYLKEQSEKTISEINILYHEFKKYQNKTRKGSWGVTIRTISHWDLYLIEACLSCFLYKNDSTQGYELAKNYCKKYDPSYGTGLIPESIPFLKDIIEFWEAYYLD